MDYHIERFNDVFRMSFPNVLAQQERYIMLSSDIHFDSKQFKRSMFKRQFDEALKRDAAIFIGGDMFDAMQGRNDPRRSHGGLSDELAQGAYFDRLVESGVELLKPYMKNIAGVGMGNHEKSVITHYGTNLIARLVERINQEGGNCVDMGYQSYVFVSIRHKQDPRSAYATFKMKYHHGAGGNSPVTKGAIKANRRSVYLSDADIVWSGHTHFPDLSIIRKERVTKNGHIKRFNQYHVVTPGYQGRGAWAIEKDFAPEANGCAWLKFLVSGKQTRDKERATFSITMDVG